MSRIGCDMPEHTGEGELVDMNVLELRVEELWKMSLDKLKGKNNLVNSLACLNILKAVRPYIDNGVYTRLHGEYLAVQNPERESDHVEGCGD